MKNLKVEEAEGRIVRYFASRKRVRRDGEGRPLLTREGEALYDIYPATVTGLARALGLSRREELYDFKNKKIKALVDRALLKIEEEAEEKLFFKDTFQGAKAFLAANFPRHAQEDKEETDLGVCTLWAE